MLLFQYIPVPVPGMHEVGTVRIYVGNTKVV
jgi:hypothetical protein